MVAFRPAWCTPEQLSNRCPGLAGLGGAVYVLFIRLFAFRAARVS